MNDRRIDALTKLYKHDSNAKLVLDWVASRERNSSDTQIESFMKNVQIDRFELIATLHKLERVGMGKFIAGRRGHASRFAWAVGLVSAGRVAQGKMHTLENLPDLSESKQLMTQGDIFRSEGKVIMLKLTREQLEDIIMMVKK